MLAGGKAEVLRTAYCEHLLPRKAGLSVPFHGMVHDAQPYGLAQEWRGSNAVAVLHLQLVLPYEDEIRSVVGPDAGRRPKGTRPVPYSIAAKG